MYKILSIYFLYFIFRKQSVHIVLVVVLTVAMCQEEGRLPQEPPAAPQTRLIRDVMRHLTARSPHSRSRFQRRFLDAIFGSNDYSSIAQQHYGSQGFHDSPSHHSNEYYDGYYDNGYYEDGYYDDGYYDDEYYEDKH